MSKTFIDKLLASDDDTLWRAGKMLDEAATEKREAFSGLHDTYIALNKLSSMVFRNTDIDGKRIAETINVYEARRTNIFTKIDEILAEKVAEDGSMDKDSLKNLMYYVNMFR